VSCSSPAGGGPETGPSSYTVTFKSGYGENETLYTKTVTSPATAVGAADFPANPFRSDYAFTGWNTQPNGSGTPFTASTSVNADIAVYALWTATPPGSHTVAFRLNDGTETVHAVKTVTPPAAVVGAADFPADPARNGYTFAGWNTQPNGSGTDFTASTTVNADITVYARWTAYNTVTFRLNDGTEAVHGTKTVTPPATTVGTADFPADPDRNGYAFLEWNTQPNGSGTPFTASTTVSGDITVYAQWTELPPGSHTVTFKSGYGENGTLHIKTVTPPATTVGAADFPADPARNGYNFGGWYTLQNGGGSAFTASTAVSGDLTVYAKWDTYSYTVSFNSDGGSAAVPATKTVASPAINVGSLPADPAKGGYRFDGWYTLQNGGGSAFTASTAVSGDLTVYAKWDTYSYTVTFDKNDGDTEADPTTKTVASPAETVDSLPTQPSRDGCTFAGWNTQPNGSGTPFTAATTVSGTIIVYAQWTGDGAITLLDPDDAGDGAFEDGGFTLSKTANGNPDNQTITITGEGYTNPRWLVDGTLKGTGTSLAIAAADYPLGPHNLSLLVTKYGVTWSRDIVFTVEN
jgi:uncharacterized repeat protein (TIGR02543 family)